MKYPTEIKNQIYELSDAKVKGSLHDHETTKIMKLSLNKKTQHNRNEKTTFNFFFAL